MTAVKCTVPLAFTATGPIFQVMVGRVPALYDPPSWGITFVRLASTTSVMTTPVAFILPVFL